MSTLTLQANLPWTVSHEEDRRFRIILLQVLLVSLVIGVATPYIHIPRVDLDREEQLPPRRVRLITEQPLPEPPPAVVPEIPEVQEVSQVPVAQQVPEKVVPPEPAPPVPLATPRDKAASSGVLAMREALSELRSSVPRTGTLPGSTNRTERRPLRAPQPSVLTAGVNRGSKGVEGGVTHESVLGASEIPGREQFVQGFDSGNVPLPGAARTASPSPGPIRSAEEIQEVLDRNKGAMYTLYNRALHYDPSLRGKLVMRITITPDGRVLRCSIINSELGSDSLEQQLVALVRGIDFGDKPGVATVTTRIPVEFFPR